MPFKSLKFHYDWRPYQKRVLDAIEDHLEDKRLHIVAAPGAGKTTLGLEVFKRLQKSALVLSPTRVIRDQWVERLADFCDGDPNAVAWVSKDLDHPETLTSITYQALHSKLKDELANEDEELESLDDVDAVTQGDVSEFVQTLLDHNIQVLILDEAHHLKAEWWRALDKVCESIPDLVLVSLTATPPYDSQSHEWNRYEALCGPIDEEISVPELVKAGTLCAHQDFIWAVDVTSSDRQKVKDFDDRVSTLCHTLFTQNEFENIVSAHPWLHDGHHEQAILKSPEIAVAILVFLKEKQRPLPPQLITTLDLSLEDIPELGRRWWQVLLSAVLFSSTFSHSDAHKESVDQLKKQLRASELLHKRELSIVRSRRLGRSLSLSIAKVDACVDIHKLELEHRSGLLRQVILTDYIRDEQLNTGIDTGDINLGAWPIYREITSVSPIANQVALLTGRVSILHDSLVDKFFALVDKDRFNVSPMQAGSPFMKVTGPLNQLTKAMTELLKQGVIKTLVGTRSLLGEGWDAPVVNSLVLASSVGSFMLTNQMRGRAIRIDKSIEHKTSSIWHLVAVDCNSYHSGYSDFYDLRDRFETFVGLSEKKLTIESGFARMDAKDFRPVRQVTSISPVAANNKRMVKRYRDLDSVSGRWNEALTLNESARVVPSVQTPSVPGLRTFHLKNTLKAVLIDVLGAVATTGLLVSSVKPGTASGFLMLLGLAILGGLVYKLPKTIAAVRILLKHLPLEGSMEQIGTAVCAALCQAGLVETSFRRLKVSVSQDSEGKFYVALIGATFYESSLFSDSLAEVLAPIENPRYLVVREGKLFGLERDDYHAVPLRLAVKKDLANMFYKAWSRYVGPSELIYTRNDTGRARLVKARMQAFSSVFSREVKRQDRWC